MTARIIEIDNISQAAKEMMETGSHKMGIDIMTPKSVFRAVKLKAISTTAANIIKQEMLSFGGEAVVAHGTVNHSISSTDVLIVGTLKQIHLLIEKLKLHQFGLPDIAKEIDLTLKNYEAIPKPLEIKGKRLDFSRRTYIMGVLNVTPDSFSDGGKFTTPEVAIKHARKMIRDGADIIDVGGESTRPGAKKVTEEEEISRVVPVIQALKKECDTIISIDTRKSKVAKKALACGADMVNDISGLHFDSELAKVAADFGVPVCIMHIQGTPENMQANPSYQDLMGEIINYLKEGLEIAQKAGILHRKIIIDPGIGFGKTVEHNLEILRRLRELKVLGRPILIGTSRKSLIGKVLDLPVEQRIEGSAATLAVAIMNGANIVRVHDVREMGRVAKMVDSIVKEGCNYGQEKESA